MFIKKYSYSGTELYENLLRITKFKRIVFGYFIFGENDFCGINENGILKIFCSEILLRTLNPMIIVEKGTDSTNVTIKYNLFHYYLMASPILLCALMILLFMSDYPEVIVYCIIAIVVFLIGYKLNFEYCVKRINNCVKTYL